jgi:hypothetical protein
MWAMLEPGVRWYSTEGELRELGRDAAIAVAKQRKDEGILSGARLLQWASNGDRVAFVVVLDGGHLERAYLCTLDQDRITEVRDCRDADEAMARLRQPE